MYKAASRIRLLFLQRISTVENLRSFSFCHSVNAVDKGLRVLTMEDIFEADFEKTAVSYQQQMINKIWAQAGMKALAEIADIYTRMTSTHDSSLFDDSFAMDFINYGDKIIYCAMYLYVGYINEATNFAESQGGGGSDTKDWGREKDEDEIEWIRRCLRQATKMMKPMKRKGLSR